MIVKSERKLTNVYIIVRIKYQKEISGIVCDKEDDFHLYRRETILQAFNRFTTKNNITLYNNKEKYFYLIRDDNNILIDKKANIMDLGINNNDTIEVLTAEKNLETNGDFIYTIKSSKKNSKKFFLILIIIGIILILSLTGFLLYYFIFRKPEEIIKKRKNINRKN